MTAAPLPTFRLDNRRALVAGASSGIGLACARILAEAGAAVTLAARRLGEVEAAAALIREAGGRAEGAALDIADIEATARFVREAEPFDVLVNSAGMGRHAPALEATAADFDAVMAVNLRGAFFLTRSVAARLKAAGRPGSLVNISSQMAHVGGTERAVYCASKHAVEGFTKAMAIEWGPLGIRVNTVCPTFVETPMTAATFADPERMRWVRSMIPLGRVAGAEDIAGAVLFLAGDAAAMVTGTAIRVDGGWTAG